MKAKGIHAAPVLLVIVFLLLILTNYADVSKLGLDDNPYLAIIILQVLILAIPSVFYTLLRGKSYTKRLRLRFPRAGHISVMIYSLGAMIFGSSAISFLIYRLAPGVYLQSNAATFSTYTSGGTTYVLYGILAFAVLPAVTEEYLFRGIIVTEYEDSGIGVAIIMSSLTFAMSHFSFVQLPVYLFDGLVLVLLIYMTRSLIATMIVHTLVNVFSLYFSQYIYRIAERQGDSMTLMIIISVSLFLLFMLLLFARGQRIYKQYGKMNIPSEYTEKREKKLISVSIEPFLSPMFLILVAIYIVATAVIDRKSVV